jgi:hypothetical protein
MNLYTQTGRIGAEAPAEHIIASVVAAMGSYNLVLTLPFARRFGHRVLSRSVVPSVFVTGATIPLDRPSSRKCRMSLNSLWKSMLICA